MNHYVSKISYIFLFALFSCQSAETNQKTTYSDPQTVEEIARQWQKYIDNNEFEAAKKLSTQKGIEWIEIMETFFEEDADTAFYETSFLEMKCFESKESAFCTYRIKEEEFEIQDTFFLIKENNQWLVDIPETDYTPTEEEIKAILEGL